MTEVVLNGNKSVKIKAIKKSNIYSSLKSTLYIVNEISVWIPNSVSKFDPGTGDLIIYEWFYKKMLETYEL
jgi:hypothetical protein